MLRPASLYKDQLDRRFAETAFDEYYKFLHCNNYVRLQSSIADNTWERIQFVGIIQDAVESFFAAEIDRNSNSVSAMSMMKFPNADSIEFTKDLHEFFISMFDKFKFRKINFSGSVSV